MRRRDVHLFDVLLGAVRRCLWIPYAHLGFTDARPGVIHPVVSLLLCSLLPLVVLAQTIFCISVPASHQKVQLKLPENVKTA